jgi:hypothetical protein
MIVSCRCMSSRWVLDHRTVLCQLLLIRFPLQHLLTLVFFALQTSQLFFGRFRCGADTDCVSTCNVGRGPGRGLCGGGRGGGGGGGGGSMSVCCEWAGGSTWISSSNMRRLCCLRSLSIVLDGLGGSGGGMDRLFFALGVSGSSLLSCLERLASRAKASGSFSSRYLRRFESLRGGGARSSYVLCIGTCL